MLAGNDLNDVGSMSGESFLAATAITDNVRHSSLVHVAILVLIVYVVDKIYKERASFTRTWNWNSCPRMTTPLPPSWHHNRRTSVLRRISALTINAASTCPPLLHDKTYYPFTVLRPLALYIGTLVLSSDVRPYFLCSGAYQYASNMPAHFGYVDSGSLPRAS